LVPTKIIEVTPEACPCGQREFHAPTPYHTHQVIELPEVHVQVTHVILHKAHCPQCDRLLKAPLPENYRYGYGPRLTALIGELSGSQRDSRSMVQEFCTSVLGVPMSRGAIQRVVERVSEAITPHYEAIAERPASHQSTSLMRRPGISTACWPGCG
jgi:transposase